MRVLLFVSDISRIGGIQQYNRSLVRALQELGFDVVLVERMDGFFSKIKFFLVALVRVFFLKVDLTICSHVNYAFFGYVGKILLNKEYFVIVHGIDVWEIKSRLRVSALEFAKKIISVSRFTSDSVIAQFPGFCKKIIIIPDTVDGERFCIFDKPKYLLNRHRIKDSVKIVLTVCRFDRNERYKGYDRVIEALPKVLEVHKELVYMLVGEGEDLARVKSLVERSSLQGNVVFVGPVLARELVDYYNICDLFIMPSRGEGFGIVYLEALACGKPVVAGNKDGSRDALLNGELGFLVDPDDVDEIAHIIIRILKKEVPARLISSDNLRERVLEIYGFESFKNRVFSVVVG